MKCLVCGEKAEYMVNEKVPLCEDCLETLDDDECEQSEIEEIEE